MSDDTFQGYVEKKKLQFKNPENIEAQNYDTHNLQEATHALKSAREYDNHGFKTEEVSKAAAFILKAEQYGLNARKIDVKDSPIYYKMVKGKKCARGYFERKRLQKAGYSLIKHAKVRQKEFSDYFINADITINEEQWERKTPEMSGPVSESDNIIDRFIANGTIEDADEYYKEEVKNPQKSRHFLKNSTWKAMDNQLPDLSKMIHIENGKMMQEYNNYLISKPTKEDIEKKKAALKKEYDSKVLMYKKIFTDAKNGLISPEAIKVFLKEDVITLDTSETKGLYNAVNYRDEKSKRGYSDAGDYEKEIEAMKDEYTERKGNTQLQDNTFLFFEGPKFLSKKPQPKAFHRIYITPHTDKQVEMIRALRKAMDTHPDFRDNIRFKVSASTEYKRLDNVVIYLNENVTKEDANKMIKTFKELCGDDVLETKEFMPLANKYESDGISSGPEFVLNQMFGNMKQAGLADQTDFNKHVEKANYSTSPSYNQLISRILFASVNMARKKHPELGPDDKIQDSPEAMKDIKLYFSDLLRLSGVDPVTMSRNV